MYHGVFLEIGCYLKTCKDPGFRRSGFQGLCFFVFGWMFAGRWILWFISGSWVVGLVGVHLYRSIGLEKSSPRADDHGFGHHGAAREHAGEEDDVGSFCTKAWPVVVVVHIYIHIQF